MTRENTTKPISLRLSPIVRKTVKKISDDSGLIQAQIYDMILRAGCKAIAEKNFRFPFPLKFEVFEDKKK
jgi:hypothetical protein